MVWGLPVLLEVGLLRPDLRLLLLAPLFHKVLLVLLCILVRVIVVGLGVGLRHARRQHAEERSNQKEADAGRFHGLPCEQWFGGIVHHGSQIAAEKC